ncbi:sulfite exporter TauE/SafE family protein [Halocynthiibacter sp. C4]|uniref:sulfite exporter TauE/SafE family protein n=1 Tax=Halocynthiibacter sp. C4 TaxID=2992758 RepID=UPI00237A26A5|nr:sulfite exporter TauE/SafE family protein [Halocynthiibacter sp. C4]MDE0589928.1 sulfite exporter TauE/SafE family protein [Halocynthiibacter sp. C4]
MLEVFAPVLEVPGLIPMVLAVLVGGIVMGFAGFGSGLIFFPVAAAFVSPHMVVTSFALTTIGSIFTVLPNAWRDCEKRRTITMVLPAFAGLLAGIFVLRYGDPVFLRWLITLLVLVTLVAMVLGWRRTVGETPRALASIGGAAGVVGGASGLFGPVVILFNLSGTAPARVTRANILTFLIIVSSSTIPILYLQGLYSVESFGLGLLFVPVYMIGTLFGQALFVPKYERHYRIVGYLIVAGAVLVGLPIWG